MTVASQPRFPRIFAIATFIGLVLGFAAAGLVLGQDEPSLPPIGDLPPPDGGILELPGFFNENVGSFLPPGGLRASGGPGIDLELGLDAGIPCQNIPLPKYFSFLSKSSKLSGLYLDS